ncbi:MAG TPA: hypothetical protein V6D15_09500 [Oculatellaceae cyanobacterium]
MKKIKNKQHKVKKSKERHRKTPQYNKSHNSMDAAYLKLIRTNQLSARDIDSYIREKQEREKRRKNAEIRRDWLLNYNLRLSSLHEIAFGLSKGISDAGTTFIEYIYTDCQDYLPAGTPTTPESYAESCMGVRNYVINDIALSFKSMQSWQEDWERVREEKLKLEWLTDFKLNEDYPRIIFLNERLASIERTIKLIKQCDYSTHRVVCVADREPVLVSLSSLENSIFDEHDRNWVCNFNASHICVGNLEECLDKCNYINEDMDKPLLKKVCLHTGHGSGLFSNIEWNPIKAEKLRIGASICYEKA